MTESFEEQNRKMLRDIFSTAALPLPPEQEGAFLRYFELLVERNRVMNLTAITEPEEVFRKHFLDSAILWSELEKAVICLPEPCSVIDVGTGAGFPGVPLKIVKPEISLTLLDALQKRIGFLKEVAETLDLQGVTLVHSRSEDAAKPGKPFREQYDLAVSRAVSQLNVLSEYCLPFVRVGGLFAAYKSADCEEELHAAAHALEVLGGSIEQVLSYSLPGSDIGRSLVVIRKVRPTPEAYPRKAGKPEKKPM